MSDLNGNFEIKVDKGEKVELQIICCAFSSTVTKDRVLETDTFKLAQMNYYSTIVKDIILNNDTISLNNIPLFNIGYQGYETIVETKKYLWGLIKRKHYYSDLFGEEGPFTYKNILYLIVLIMPTIRFYMKKKEKRFM